MHHRDDIVWLRHIQNFIQQPQEREPLTPEKRFWYYFLAEGLYRAANSNDTEERDELFGWITSPDRDVCTLRWLAETLDVDYTKLRRLLIAKFFSLERLNRINPHISGHSSEKKQHGGPRGGRMTSMKAVFRLRGGQ